MVKSAILAIFLFPIGSNTGKEQEHIIYVASISWHTGIVIPGYAFPDSIWPVELNYSRFDYLEIGWGDRDFFQNRGFNPWYALKAALWPTRSALHILPLPSENLEMNYVGSKMVKLTVSLSELKQLTIFIISHMDRNEAGKVIPLKKGPYTGSQFIAGSKKYYFPKNSNVWAAKALKEAGFRYAPLIFQTTGMVVNRADNFGDIIIEN